MTIPSERILMEIEKHLERAHPEDPANMRETLAAIRALCNVVLEDDVRPRAPGLPKATPLRQTAPVQQSTPVQLNEKRFLDDDANGDSLFDF